MNHGRVASKLYWTSVVCWVLLGLALRWQLVEGTLICDDWDHYAMYAGIYPAPRGALDMFNFVGDDDAERAALHESGRLPWWSSKDLHLAVFRPLSSALLHFDYAVLDADQYPWRAHLHSILWWIVLMAGTGLLLWLLLPPSIASVAMLLYAVDDAHILPVAWIANRSELVAAALMVWGICGYVACRTRRAGSHVRVAALVLIAFALYAGEYAFGLLAYCLAFELTRSSEPRLRRMLALVPVVLVALLYLIPRQLLGYGVSGSTFYIDPMVEPGRFLAASTQRIPMLVGDLMLGYSADWENWPPPWLDPATKHLRLPSDWITHGNLRSLQIGLGSVAALATVLAIAWLARRRATNTERMLCCLLLGAMLSLAPLCGTVPMTRLTVGAAIGTSACLAAVLCWLYATTLRSHSILLRALTALVAVAIFGVHGAYAATRTLSDTDFQVRRSHIETAWALDADLDAGEVAQQHVMMISGPDWASQLALPYIWHWGKRLLPKSSEVLSSSAATAASVARIAPNVIDLHIALNRRAVFDRSGYRRATEIFRPGDKFSMPRYDVFIMATDAGEPTTVRFIFPFDVDDRRYVFLHPYSGGLQRFPMPKIGGTIQLPHPAWPSDTF